MTAGSRHLNLRFPLHADAGLLAVKIWFSILEKLVARTRSRYAKCRAWIVERGLDQHPVSGAPLARLP
jgi:hypothetical protein